MVIFNNNIKMRFSPFIQKFLNPFASSSLQSPASSNFILSFKVFSHFGSTLAIFPFYLSNSTGKWKFHSSFARKSFCYTICIVTITIIVQLTPDYLIQSSWARKVQHPTDRFAFFCFLGTFFFLRVICYAISMWKSSSVVTLIQKFHYYDQEFARSSGNKGTSMSNEMATGKISPFCLHLWLLVFGSFTTILGNFLVAQKDFAMLISGETHKYYLINVITGRNTHLAIFLIFFSHSICEFAFVFYMGTLVYLVRGLKQKLLELKEVLNHFSNPHDKSFALTRDWTFLPITTKFRMSLDRKNHWVDETRNANYFFEPVSKFRYLIEICREINSFCGEFILIFVGLSQLMMIFLIHVTSSTLISLAATDQARLAEHWDPVFGKNQVQNHI